MSRRYRAVFLDVGATLVDAHPSFHAVVARICSAHGFPVSPLDVERAEPRVWAEIQAREARGHSYGLSRDEAERFWLDVYHWFMRELGAEDPGHLPRALYEEFLKLETWRLFPDVLPTLHALAEHGYTLAVVSNWEDWLEELLISLEIASLFEYAVISGVEMVAKPDRRVYRRALELGGFFAHEVVHVGDSMTNDVAPASDVGIAAVLLDRKDALVGRHEPRIRTLRELPGLLEAGYDLRDLSRARVVDPRRPPTPEPLIPDAAG